MIPEAASVPVPGRATTVMVPAHMEVAVKRVNNTADAAANALIDFVFMFVLIGLDE